MVDQITMQLPIEVRAVLRVVPTEGPDGNERDATTEDLKGLGYTHRNAAYDKWVAMLKAAGVASGSREETDAVSFLRYMLMEHLAWHDHMPDEDDLRRLKFAIECLDRHADEWDIHDGD